jgi:hypothetical protein
MPVKKRKFKDTLVRIKWNDPNELPKEDYLVCVVKVRLGRTVQHLIGEWLVCDIAKVRADLKEKEPNRKFPVFKYFRFSLHSVPEIYLGSKDWKRVVAWGVMKAEK